MLDRAAFLQAINQKLPTLAVEVPGLGTALVRRLTGKEKDSFEAGNWKTSKSGERVYDPSNYRGRLAALVLGDEAGNRLFEDDAAEQLGDLDSVKLDAIVDAAHRHNGMTEKAREEVEKNSAPTTSAASSGE